MTRSPPPGHTIAVVRAAWSYWAPLDPADPAKWIYVREAVRILDKPWRKRDAPELYRVWLSLRGER